MNRVIRRFTVLGLLVAAGCLLAEQQAEARAGGGRSMGSRGGRSYSRPITPSSPASPSRQYSPGQPSRQAPMAPPGQQRRGLFGNFGSGLLGGIAGGLLGGMLFRSLGFGGGVGAGGGGIGLFEILLLAGIGYLIYRFIKKRSTAAVAAGPRNAGGGNLFNMEDYQRQDYQQGYQPEGNQSREYPPAGYDAGQEGVQGGLANIRQMDPYFDERRFSDQVMDMFFKVQGAWMHRDLSGISNLLSDEMRRSLQEDVERMIRERKTNRLENIAVRSVEISEAWQEAGQDYITASIYANLLDYTTDDSNGAVTSGSKTDPVKFQEYWTFVRPVGNNPWKLSAIQQV